MVAWMKSPLYNYLVEYKPHSVLKNETSRIYIYATSEINAKEILADYKVLSVEKL
tara:strand:- start:181 stop:345 length:165 start_codon:yes stop_codon:yes gene_type:complete